MRHRVVATPSLPRDAPAVSIPAQLERFDGGSSNVTITNGVPFRPGDLTTAMLTAKKLRVFVGGTEKAIYTEALDGRHADGSVKFALVQFTHTFTNPTAAEIRLGEVRQTTDISKQTLNTAPNFLLYPTSTTYLCATKPFWHSLTPMSNRPTGTYWDDWEKKCRSTSPFTGEGWKSVYDWAIAHPSGPPPLPDSLVFPTYDPCLKPHYEFFCMSGDAYFIYRGLSWASYYLDGYAKPNSWGIGEQFMTGLVDAMIHYWLTGDTTSRDAPLTAYANDPRMFNISAANMADRTYSNNHGRMHHNKLMNLVIGHHLQLSSVPSWESGAATWAAKALLLVDSAITQQFSDGHNTWPDVSSTDPPGQEQPWQVAMRSTALIAYYVWIDPDSRIPTHVRDGYDYYNDNWWNGAGEQKAWAIIDAAGKSIAAELNGFSLEVVAFLYRVYGGSSYTTRGDEAMDGIGTTAYWSNAAGSPKHPNAINWGTMSYIAARQGVA